MQVETIYIFKNYLYIATSGFFSQNKDLSNILGACYSTSSRWLSTSHLARAREIVNNYNERTVWIHNRSRKDHKM